MIPRPAFAAFALTVGLGGSSLSTVTAQELDKPRESALVRIFAEQARAHLRARIDAVVPVLPVGRPEPILSPGAKARLARVDGGRVKPPTVEGLFERALGETYARLGPFGPGCCPCASTASCQDGLFCNGTESCVSGGCAAGTPVVCVDGDPCTNDLCTENTESCSFPPVPPPPAVARIDLSRVPSTTVANLAWSPVAGASTYNVYRGAFSNLGDLACLQGGVTGTSQNDDGAIPTRAFYYLVSSLACSESDLGSGNPGLRPPAPGCP